MPTHLLISPKVDVCESTRPVDSTSSKGERIRLVAVGSKEGITSIIYSLHRLGFANAGDWSRFVPAQNEGEVMSILSKYVVRL